jgi:hypothetical protein
MHSVEVLPPTNEERVAFCLIVRFKLGDIRHTGFIGGSDEIHMTIVRESLYSVVDVSFKKGRDTHGMGTI